MATTEPLPRARYGKDGWGAAQSKERDQEKPARTKGKSKIKNTRKWCKGRKDVPHTPVLKLLQTPNWRLNQDCYPSEPWMLELFPDTPWRCLHYYKCSTCGKNMHWLTVECPDRPQ